MAFASRCSIRRAGRGRVTHPSMTNDDFKVFAFVRAPGTVALPGVHVESFAVLNRSEAD